MEFTFLGGPADGLEFNFESPPPGLVFVRVIERDDRVEIGTALAMDMPRESWGTLIAQGKTPYRCVYDGDDVHYAPTTLNELLEISA